MAEAHFGQFQEWALCLLATIAKQIATNLAP